MSEKTIQDQIAAVQLETAQLQLERQKEENAQYKARKAEKERQNAQRQEQLSIDRNNRVRTAALCTHRQGGTPRNPMKGKGPTALKRIKMPDGFTVLIACSICRLRKYSPHPMNKSPKRKKDESEAQAKARVEKYEADVIEFARLNEEAEDGLTAEATQPMDCGVKFRVTDADGRPVYRQRPCDSYALQM